MTSINGGVPARVPADARGANAAPSTEPTSLEGGTEATDRGILVKDPSGTRLAMRIGGGLAALGGVGALVAKSASGGGLAGAGGVLPLAIGGAVVGAALIGSSFLGGLQPKYKPLAEAGIPDFEQAQQRAAARGDDVAIVNQSGGRFGLVDFADQDFDNADLGNLKLDTENVSWAGLVSKDGDLLRPTGEGTWSTIGRASPDPVAATRTSVGEAGSLTGQRIGTTDAHQPAALGRVVGDPAGYATIADAAKAADAQRGPTAIVQLGDRFALLEAALPTGVAPTDLQARGTAVAPVTALTLEDRLKLFRPSVPGSDFAFAGRSLPFDTKEPIGSSIAGHKVERLIRSSARQSPLVEALKRDDALVDAVFFGRRAGAAVLRTQDPDGTVGFHSYQLGTGSGQGDWDQELGTVEARLGRFVRTDRNVTYNAPVGVDSDWAINQAYVLTTDLQRTTAELTGFAPLRDSGWVQTSQEVDYFATQRYREQLRQDLFDRMNPPVTSPGDDPLTGPTSPGDDPIIGLPGSGPTAGGDDPIVGIPSPPTTPGTGGTAGGDDPVVAPVPSVPVPPVPGSGAGSGSTGDDPIIGGPTVPDPTPPVTVPADDSTNNGNPDEGDF